MKKVLIWGTGIDYESNIVNFKYHELIGNIKVIGVTGNEKYFSQLDNYIFISKEDIKKVEFDYIFIASKRKFFEIKKEANDMGISDERIIKLNVLRIPDLNFDKYIALKNSNISILSNNCWGGLAYNYLGLKFNSPFVNMFESAEDYIKILKDLSSYMETPLKFFGTGYNDALNINYPIALLKDAKLYMNHIESFSEAKEKWEERKIRLNNDNLFVMMYTDNKEMATEFEKLNYAKKICFVPFQTDLPSAFFLDFKNLYEKGVPFWQIVSGCAYGQYKCYDIIDLLLTGKCKKTNRIIT